MTRPRQFAAWAAIAALAWHAQRTAARTRRLEQATGTWRVADPAQPRTTSRARYSPAHPSVRATRWPRGPLQVRGHG